MATPLRALVVEDNEADAMLLERELRRGGFDLTSHRVETWEEMATALERQAWDIVFSDFSMPRFSMDAALSLIKAKGLDLPFIIVSGTVGDAAAVAAMRQGAHDFMAKGDLTRLLPAVERELREAAGRHHRRQIEEQLRRSQRMEAIGQLTGGLAHDFNNLLTIIIGSLDLLQADATASVPVRSLAETALRASLRGADLTRQLLAFARRQSLDAKVFDLNERVAGTAELLRRTLGEPIKITMVLAESLWPSIADPTQVESALVNLAINARDAMPEGGELTIVTANARLDERDADLDAAPGEYVMLAVTDTGTGIPAEILDRVLEPFFTTKPHGKGTGLGLSMVYGFVKQSHGHLKIDSEPGRGTTVRLYLPRASEGMFPETIATGATAADPAPEQTTIFVVEDNVEVRALVVAQLTSLGYHVIEASDGPSALVVLKGGLSIDLLLTDVVMPGGMRGTDLAKAARALRPDLKILFSSGFVDAPDMNDEDVQALGGLLNKPYRRSELARRIEGILRCGGTVS